MAYSLTGRRVFEHSLPRPDKGKVKRVTSIANSIAHILPSGDDFVVITHEQDFFFYARKHFQQTRLLNGYNGGVCAACLVPRYYVKTGRKRTYTLVACFVRVSICLLTTTFPSLIM